LPGDKRYFFVCRQRHQEVIQKISDIFANMSDIFSKMSDIFANMSDMLANTEIQVRVLSLLSRRNIPSEYKIDR
jgi:hypothetical protein